jgi:hypothetical protein
VLIAIYTLFVGLLLATFVGVGIAAFAPEPRFPEPPIGLRGPFSEQPSPEARRELEEFEQRSRAHRVEVAAYSRNVSVVAAVAAIIMLVLSLTILRPFPIFSDGFLFGGILTFGYSVVRGFGAEDNVFRFVIVALGLGIALALGYVRFIRPAERAAAKPDAAED